MMTAFKSPPISFAIMLMMPFIQIGYSFYFSIAFILFSFCFIKSIRFYKKDIYTLMFLSCLCFFYKSITVSTETGSQREFLIPLREMLCLVSIISIATRIQFEKIDLRLTGRLITYFLFATLALVIFQNYMLSRGAYWGIPIDYFVTNQETLIGAEDALFHHARFRATAYYGEPSYTSFIVFSLLTIYFATQDKLSNKVFVAILAFAITSVSQSLAGVASVFITLTFWLLFLINYRKAKKYFLFSFFIFISVIGIFISDKIYGRIMDAIQGNDDSTIIRIGQPLALLWDVISGGAFFGVNLVYIEKYLGYSNIDNATLRLFIYYGILIIVPLLTLILFARTGLIILYIILVMNFNGELFSYDKALIVGLVIGLSKAKLENLQNDPLSPQKHS